MVAQIEHGWLRRMIIAVVGCVVVVAFVVAGTNIVMLVSTRNDIVEASEAASFRADAIVVLGASVFSDGTPSEILRDRLDDGISLYLLHAAPKIVVSGDNRTASYNEVKAMKDYVISKGVPSDDVFCDHAGFSTYESMYRAQQVFKAQRIIVATQTYHLYRALYAAKGLGMEAVGVPSDYHTYSKQISYDFREIPARTKDYFKTLFKLPSTFIGGVIDLKQSGNITD